MPPLRVTVGKVFTVTITESELEQPLAIARDIKKLYVKLTKNNQKETVANFLLNNDELRHVVRRAFIAEKFPYSEIQDNTIGASLVPIDMLRLKLSFFGAVKFDPRSDKWLRINMYQGAPLPHEMKFSNEKKLMKIEELYAIGPAISVLMSGYVQEDELISLRGTLVPATTINRSIASIPLIGDLLIGKKVGEGVFGVSFKIKGPPKDLETTVNPIKTLTPRFITRTLEKIKKN